VVDQLIVQHPQAEADASIQVVGMDGRKLLTRNVQEGTVQTKVDVKTLVPGNYMVIYSINGQRQSKLFLKQ
jgi:YbbR domain-containing protein